MTHPIIIRDEAARQRLAGIIARLNLDKAWEVTIEPHKKRRSLSQNAYLHKILSVVASETGNSMDAVKEAYKEMFLGRVPVRLGDEERLVVRSTAALSTQEMAEFVDQIIAHATSELGLYVPFPEEGHLG